MSWLSKMFGSSDKGSPKGTTPDAAAVEYQGFRIVPAPQKADGGFRIGARIERDGPDGPQVHRLIRADVINDYDTAVEASIGKARQMIDEQGARLFD